MEPKDPSLISFPIEYLGIYFAVEFLVGVYWPGPGLLYKEVALIGLLAVNDLFCPSTPRTCLCWYYPGPGLTIFPTHYILSLSAVPNPKTGASYFKTEWTIVLSYLYAPGPGLPILYAFLKSSSL